MEQADGVSFPVFDVRKRREVRAEFFAVGDRKPAFEDKVAVSATGQYNEADRQAWVKTTSNYFVSKAFEMASFLPRAESAQSQQISHAHVHALQESGCMCGVEPLQLSKDLWGYLNLALTGKQKLAFNNVPQGSGFETWRRLVVPIAPRSDARLNDMQSDVNVPPKSKRLADVMDDIDTWEGQLLEYYKLGGDHMSDRTKIIIYLRMLPQATPSSFKMAFKGVGDFESSKDELRSNIKYLQDFGGLAAAHVMADEPAQPQATGTTGDGQEKEEGTITVDDFPVFMLQNLSSQEKDGLVAAVNRAAQQRRQQAQPRKVQPAPKARPAPPPRDARDVKCANCGQGGHTAAACKKPRIPVEERRCHTCGKQGHIASKCPDKPANVAETAQEATARPQPGTIFAVEDEDGFVPAQRRVFRPRPLTLADLPITVKVSQAARRRKAPVGNRFQAIAEEEEPCSTHESRQANESPPRDEARARTFRGLSLTACGCGRGAGERCPDESPTRQPKSHEPRLGVHHKRAENFSTLSKPEHDEMAGAHSVISEPNTDTSHRETHDPEGDARREALLMYSEDEETERDGQVMNVQWTEVDIEVVLDSGCSDHVMNVELDAPGYRVGPSEGSRAGRGFIVGNGERVGNDGQAMINLRAVGEKGEGIEFSSMFQSAKVTRPLMSVAKVCQNGYTCHFTATEASVKDKQSHTVCKFKREGGIYEGRMELRAPAPFGGPA